MSPRPRGPKTTGIVIRVPDDLLDRIREVAAEDRRTPNAWIVLAAERAIIERKSKQ